ncbi:MAG TPA: NAD(P)/FAD-dependent oxidoreductase [Woeseiaceae bacterium]|nr:NAD(P)/FAD-dependent oxidoreductase [Woeseiaceae bacterium]
MGTGLDAQNSGSPKVVIVGAGFGGLAAAAALARAPVAVTLIDRQNHHLFQPLLYQVATAALSPADIAWPIRRILRRQRNVRILLGDVTGIDNKHVLLGEKRIPFDMLVLASGATHAYFGHQEWEAHAPGLKTVVDALEIRRRILTAFEQAEMEMNAAECERLLTFVMVGGGPTGVEMAGAISELARRALAADFRHIDPRRTRVTLVEAGPRLLPSFPASLGHYARVALEKLGVDVRLGVPVSGCDARGVSMDGTRIDAGTVVWTAGVAASPVAAWLDVPADRAGRVEVDANLEVPGRPGVFVIGDAAACTDFDGSVLPGVAPVAKQQGRFAGRLIEARSRSKPEPGPFRYWDAGQLATIGRRAGVVDFGRIRFKGWLAWWFWGVVHIYFLINLRSRLIVAVQWLWSYLTFDRGARLIT